MTHLKNDRATQRRLAPASFERRLVFALVGLTIAGLPACASEANSYPPPSEAPGDRTPAPAAGSAAGSADPANPPDASPDAAAPAGSFSRVFEIVMAQCADCHTTSGSGGMRVGTTKESVHAALVGVAATCGGQRVVPGDPTASLLVDKIKADTPRCGSRMPLGSPKLAADDIAAIEEWIRRGAPRD